MFTITGEVNGYAVQFDLTKELPDQLKRAVEATNWLKANGVEPVKAATGGGWGGRTKQVRITDTGDKWRVYIPAVYDAATNSIDKEASDERKKAIRSIDHEIYKEPYTTKSGKESERWHYDVAKTAFVANYLIEHYSDLEGIDTVKAWVDANPDEKPVEPANVVPLHKRNKTLHIELMKKCGLVFKTDDDRHKAVKMFTGATESTQDLSDQQVEDFMAILDVILTARGFWGDGMLTLDNKKQVVAYQHELIQICRKHGWTSNVYKLLPDQSRAIKQIINKMADQLEQAV